MTKTRIGAAAPAGVKIDAESGDTVPDEDDSSEEPIRDNESTASDVEIDNVSDRGRESDRGDRRRKKKRESRAIVISLRTLLVAALVVAVMACTGVMTWLYYGERSKLAADQRQTTNDQHAEQIALDYAVNAATMNFKDLTAWKGNLVKGTTQPLNDKLTKAATSMEQLLVPLEWSSNARPLAAKVRSDTNGIFVVDTFVSVQTKTKQAPDTLQSTATYSITIDSNNNWQISDVGGIGAIVGTK